jgi:hypothetical protein
MTRLLTSGLVTLALAGLVGCSTESKPGGPGATGTTGTATTRQDTSRTDTTRTDDTANTFTVKVPAGATNVEIGQREEVTISIDRGRTFNQNVKLSFKPVEGLKVTPADATIKAGENETKVFVEAAEGAALGNKTIEVTATPDTGKATSVTMTVEVVKK